MKQIWQHIFWYGLALGLLLASFQYMHFKWLLWQNRSDWYVSMIALVFGVLGIWAGLRWNHQRTRVVQSSDDQRSDIAPPQVVLIRLGITAREYEVLKLIAQGYSNQEIADRLFVSLNTIKTHISNLLSKLDAERRTQAIQKAKLLGLLP